MKEIPCPLVRDLLPLYAESLSSEASNELIERHLAECEECKQYYVNLKEPTPPPPPEPPLRAVKAGLRKRTLRRVLLAVSLLLALGLCVLARLTEPRYVERYDEELFRVDALADKEEAEALRPEGDYAEGTRYLLYSIAAGAEFETELVRSPEEEADRLIVVAYTRPIQKLERGVYERGELPLPEGVDTVLYGFSSAQNPHWGEPLNGGYASLPRLFLGYYALLAAAAALVLGLAWLLGRKKKAAPILRQLFFVPCSYLLGQLGVLGLRTVSYAATRAFFWILAAALAVYAALTLLALIRADKRAV